MSFRFQYFVFLASVLVLVGCEMAHDSRAEYKIEVDVDKLASEKVSIYDIFSKMELIALDNTFPVSNSVYVGASSMAYDGELFYILDMKTHVINVYGSDGSLVCHADKVGRGPGEYTMADQIHYNGNLDLIEVLNPMGRILRYSTDSLKFDSEFDFSGKDLKATHNCYMDGSDYILYSFSDEEQLWRLDTVTGNMESYGYSSAGYLREYISAQAPFLEIGGQPCFLRPYDGMIYTFEKTKSRMIPYIEWDPGKYGCNKKDIPEDITVRETHDFIVRNSREKLSPFIDAKAAGDVLFANVVFNGGRAYTLCHNMKTGVNRFFEKTTEGMKFLTGLPYKNEMFKFVDAKYLPEYVSRDILDGQSQKVYDEVITSDGCAIIRYSLK